MNKNARNENTRNGKHQESVVKLRNMEGLKCSLFPIPSVLCSLRFLFRAQTGWNRIYAFHPCIYAKNVQAKCWIILPCKFICYPKILIQNFKIFILTVCIEQTTRQDEWSNYIKVYEAVQNLCQHQSEGSVYYFFQYFFCWKKKKILYLITIIVKYHWWLCMQCGSDTFAVRNIGSISFHSLFNLLWHLNMYRYGFK